MSIWFTPPSLQAIAQFRQNTLVETLDIRVTEIGDDFLRGTMPVNDATRQPYGILHGGASVSLAESLGSIAAGLVLDISKQYPVGLEINANHVKAVASGLVTATAKPLHLGRKTQVWEIKIRNDKDQLACVSRFTVAVLDRDQGTAQ